MTLPERASFSHLHQPSLAPPHRRSEQAAPIRVLVIDPSPLMQAGLRTVLGPLPDIEHAASFPSVDDALPLLHRGAPDIILLAVSAGDDSDTKLRRLRAAAPEARIIVLSATLDPPSLRALLAAGAAGYLPTTVDLFTLTAAIRNAVAGGVTLTQEAAQALLAWEELRHTAQVRLTARQRDVLRLLVTGASNQQIARSLGISVATVKFHVAGLLAELGAQTRGELIAVAHRSRLVGPDGAIG